MLSRPREDPVPALKRQLARAIVASLDGFTQWEAASFLQTDQARISALKRGRVEQFTLDRLIRYLNRIDHVVTMDIRHHGMSMFAPRDVR